MIAARILLARLFAAIACVVSVLAATPSMAAPSVETLRLAELAGASAVRLAPQENAVTLHFSAPPGIRAARVRVDLAASPATFAPQPGLVVSLNGGEPVALDPLPRAFSARFELEGDDLVEGENALRVRLARPARDRDEGWTLDLRRSQLDVVFLAPGPRDAAAFEAWFAADLGAPRAIAVEPIGPVARHAPELGALAAIALGRRARRPLRFGAEGADFTLSVMVDPRLSGTRLAFSGGAAPRAQLLAPDIAAVRTALREFVHAAPGAGAAEDVADAPGDLSALGQGSLGGEGYALALPADPSDRAAALSLLARLAREAPRPALPGWVGVDALEAPAGRDLAVIDRAARLPSPLIARAPRALVTSLRPPREDSPHGLIQLGARAEAAALAAGAAARFRSPFDDRAWVTVIAAAEGRPLDDALAPLIEADSLARFSGRVARWRGGVVEIQDRGAWRPPGAAGLAPRREEMLRTAGFLGFVAAGFALVLAGASMARRKFSAVIHRA